ncbi:MAG: AAA family ATPase [Planctomycetaceae bacterium]|nr:AAA family ATPase [Planctomycetaceae bacterium]
MATDSIGGHSNNALLHALLTGESFWPADPRSLSDLGLSDPLLESLICRLMLTAGNMTGRSIAAETCVSFRIVETMLERLRSRRLLSHAGSASMNDYIYGLTEDGRRHSERMIRECSYVGPAPVPFMDYVISVEAQAISDEPIRRYELTDAFNNISVPPELLETLGPAVNSASGLFLYGSPGNGKSTIAHCVTSCFGREIWIPRTVIEGREIITVFDPTYHQEVEQPGDASPYDRRWVRIRRPTVVVGGELTLDNLEIRHDVATGISEAPLQMKSNCGCLLIDDFGRQRVSPSELLNRWIVPLESRYDYLTLASGKKIQIPFEQLIIFSTNLEPSDLVDEAFLRRIPYRIEVLDPDEEEFHYLFRLAAMRLGCAYVSESVEWLLKNVYHRRNLPLRRCHPRDVLLQVRNYCVFNDIPFEMLPEHVEKVAPGFFTRVNTRPLSAMTADLAEKPGSTRLERHGGVCHV